MLLPIKKPNNGKDKSSREPFVISFVVSSFWHICLFSIICITFPNLEINPERKEVSFLGSYLKKYDLSFFESESNLGKSEHKYAEIAKENILRYDLGDYAKLPDYLQKPKRYFLTPEEAIVIEERKTYLLQDTYLPKRPISLSARETYVFDPERLPDLSIYFKEGIVRPVEFKMLISERGRVRFLNKSISSGSFDVDLLVARALRKSVFSTRNFGSSYWRTLKLDLKK